MLKVFIGFDPRQAEAYRVAEHSVRANASKPVCITPLVLDAIESWQLIDRKLWIRHNRMWDPVSEAPQSTEFALTRFLTPMLAQTGPALFLDSDVVVLGDVYELLEHLRPDTALSVVKHPEGEMGGPVKMDGQEQTTYARKNWSSVMLYNCDHRANRRLKLSEISTLPGRDLHRFCWLWDNELGALPAAWNWLVNVQAPPAVPKLAHFTLGGPWLKDWVPSPHDDLWLEAKQRMTRDETSQVSVLPSRKRGG